MAECSVSRDAAAECERTESGTVSGAQKPALSLDNAPLCGTMPSVSGGTTHSQPAQPARRAGWVAIGMLCAQFLANDSRAN